VQKSEFSRQNLCHWKWGRAIWHDSNIKATEIAVVPVPSSFSLFGLPPKLAQCTIELPTIHKVFWPAKTCSLLAFNLNWKNTRDWICMMLSVLQNFAKERLPVFQIRKTSTTNWNHSSLDWSPRAAVQRLGFIDRQKNGTFCPHLTF
jgi:hypothetical protein